VAPAHAPSGAVPAVLGAGERQHPAGGFAQAAVEDAGEAAAVLGVAEIGGQRVGVGGEAGLGHQEGPGILEGWLQAVGEPEARGEVLGEGAGLRGEVQRRGRLGGLRGLGRRGGVAPDGLAAPAPDDVQRPARQRLARVVFALPLQHEAARGEALSERLGQRRSQGPLGVTQRVGAPLGRVGVLAAVEGRLAAEGETDAVLHQPRVGGGGAREQLLPGVLGVGRGRARLVADAPDEHLELQLAGHHVAGAVDGPGQRRRRRARQRDVPLAAQEPAGPVDADPAGAGQVHLGPGVQVHDVAVHSARLVGDHPLVGELHEVAAGEPGREAGAAQRGHQQHRRVPARPAPLGQRLLGRPDPGLLADDVAHGRRDLPGQLHDVRDRAAVARVRGHERVQEWPAREGRPGGVQVGGEASGQLVGVREGQRRRVLVDEEVERVDGLDVDGELDDHVEAREPIAVAEGQARHVVGVRVLLPVDQRLLRQGEAVALDVGAGVGRRAQPHHVRAQVRRPRVDVTRSVLDQEAHHLLRCARAPRRASGAERGSRARSCRHGPGQRAPAPELTRSSRLCRAAPAGVSRYGNIPRCYMPETCGPRPRRAGRPRRISRTARRRRLRRPPRPRQRSARASA
jgi:hypothetical protein